MTTTRKQYSPRFRARVAIEAIRNERTMSQLASQFHVHPVQIGQWRRTALEQLAELFVDGRKRKRSDCDVEKDALYEEIGRLKVELDWLKKKLVCSIEERRELVETRPCRDQRPASVRTAGREPLGAVLPTSGRERGEPEADAVDR